MSTLPRNPPADWEEEPPPLVRWRSWPVADKPWGTALVAIGLAVSGVVAERVTGKWYLGALAAAVVAAALWRFFVPMMYELNADGVNQWLFGRHRRIPWGEVRRYEIHSAGVLLLPCDGRSSIDVLRGEFVPWCAHREEVLAQIRYYLEPLGGPGSTSTAAVR